jgi:hypothetical protein
VHFPSSPPSEEDAGTISLLLDTGAVSLLLNAGTVSPLEELTMFSDDPRVAEEAGVSELDDSTSAELELNFSSAKLDTGATLEDERSGDCTELDRACSEELSVTEASVPELESSPQEARNAEMAKKASEMSFIWINL